MIATESNTGQAIDSYLEPRVDGLLEAITFGDRGNLSELLSSFFLRIGGQPCVLSDSDRAFVEAVSRFISSTIAKEKSISKVSDKLRLASIGNISFLVRSTSGEVVSARVGIASNQRIAQVILNHLAENATIVIDVEADLYELTIDDVLHAIGAGPTEPIQLL